MKTAMLKGRVRLAPMLRLVLVYVAALVAATCPAAADAVEVGYIENVKGSIAKVVLTRDGRTEPVAICALVYNGDRISVTDPKGKVVLRIVGRKEPLEISPANGDFKLEVEVPRRSFVSGLLKWAATNFASLDSKTRSAVAMSVRSGPTGPLALPILTHKQIIAAGRRSLMVGWQGTPPFAEIRLTTDKGQVVASGRGTDRMWKSPPVELAPGAYKLEVSAANARIVGLVDVVTASAMPPLPADLADEAIPRDLRLSAQAAWLASQSPQYALEALQLVAADADRVHPARLMADALIGGEKLAAAQK